MAVPGGGRRGLGFWLSGDGSGALTCVVVSGNLDWDRDFFKNDWDRDWSIREWKTGRGLINVGCSIAP